ncbi:barstar family protein [Cellulomonas sp. zg-ZUI222]|uniref:Barstar family protein n=1 Tax=Cellulomonas wangleii TaxID=2816956 RepID=A0ABX8D7G4_9CELL|nr:MULTISPECIES: barstar family protein [Cellulomonas]MBO0901164.1 barstar family protein [Cellulomonas sp. zg-ZUI22]MBO0922524.1 barstar family protein [Cellulomonas wangleii]MBO0926771.1 barstar family protein [Cellulomonas wangleii]QVI63121.1 barstar family protein [Cellulomonas wangleii]
MAAFDRDADITHAVDFRIARAGGVVLCRRPQVLEDAVRSLVDLGYDVVYLNAADWRAAPTMYGDLASALQFPEHFGRNLDALRDCLDDVAHGDYGWRVGSTGLALVVAGFDVYRQRLPEEALALADVLAATSRTALLYGHRILSLLRVDDPGFRIGPVGGVGVPWHDAEWLDRDRR